MAERVAERVTPALLRRLALIAVVLLVAGLALVGFLSVTRGTPIERVLVAGSRGTLPAVDDPRFEQLMTLYTGASLTAGNRVEILANGDGTFPRLWRDLAAARRSITMQMYYAKPGAVADTLARVLTERARSGVRVLLVLDAFGTQNMPEAWLDSLRAAGVRVARLRKMRWYKVDRATSRAHVRAVVIDGVVGYTGGVGLDDKWLGAGRRPGEWRETNVRVRGLAAAQLQAAFAVAWAETTGELLAGDLFYPPAALDSTALDSTALDSAALDSAALDSAALDSAEPARAAVAFLAPTTGSTPAERFLALSIAAARRTLYVANAYFVPDDDFRRFLREAVEAGVDVRVLTAGPRIDVTAVRYASRARYEELLAGGVRIYEYQPAMMHAKTLVADGRWAVVGSMNIDNRSIALNTEANFVALDVGVGAALDSLFREDLRFAREITLDEFRQRPWWHWVLEAGATLLSRLL